MLAKSVCQIATEALACRHTYRAVSMFKPNGGGDPGMERCPRLSASGPSGGITLPGDRGLQCFPGKPAWEGSGRQSVEVEMRSDGTVKTDEWICVGWVKN